MSKDIDICETTHILSCHTNFDGFTDRDGGSQPFFFLNDGVERINEMAQPYDNDKEDDMQYFMEAR